MLSPEKKEYYVISDDKFNMLVKDCLGFEYEAVAENEWNNDSCYSSSVKKSEFDSSYFQKYDLPEIEDRIKGIGGSLSFHQILIYLVAKEFLPEGNYLIDVCW